LKWRHNPRWRIFDFLFSKIVQKSMNNFFPICKLILIQKYSYCLGKINGRRINQNGGQKSRWRQVDYFLNRNSTETPSTGFEIKI
jgi:hypothetical protein